MSANSDKPHLIIIPEDRRDNQIAIGFQNALPSQTERRQFQIVRFAGGYPKVRDSFLKNHVKKMRQIKTRWTLLLIDFDVKTGGADFTNRLKYMTEKIPDDIKDRVFVLGSLSNPEKLKKSFPKPNSFEDIGKALARDCYDGTNHAWGHDLLIHNEKELARMEKAVKPFLFPNTSN